jgi:hypothetical protein
MGRGGLHDCNHHVYGGFWRGEASVRSGMIFTALLMLGSIGTFTFAVSVGINYFLDGDYRERIRTKRIQRIMNGLQGHVIVCGWGHAHKGVIIESD